jgi:hypothetical protein
MSAYALIFHAGNFLGFRRRGPSEKKMLMNCPSDVLVSSALLP